MIEVGGGLSVVDVHMYIPSSLFIRVQRISQVRPKSCLTGDEDDWSSSYDKLMIYWPGLWRHIPSMSSLMMPAVDIHDTHPVEKRSDQ
jgi:hypothetical protein